MSDHNEPISTKSRFQIGIISLHLFLLTVLCIAYFPVLKSLVSTWMYSDEYSHGFIILPISLYIIWNRRHALAAVKTKTSWFYCIPFLIFLCIYLITSFARITTFAALTFPLTISGLILFLWGPKMVKQTIFPVFFLILMIPVPDQIYTSFTIHLQLLVSKISVFFAAAVDVPIYREGNVIHLPGHTLQVVQACSGIRSLITLLTLCIIVGYFGFKSYLLRIILSIAAVPIAIVVNVIRVFLMIMALYRFNYDLTADSVHSYFGLAVFLIALIMILVVYKGLDRWERDIIKG